MRLEIMPVTLPKPPDETTEERDIRWAKEERLSADRADKMAACFIAAAKESKAAFGGWNKLRLFRQ